MQGPHPGRREGHPPPSLEKRRAWRILTEFPGSASRKTKTRARRGRPASTAAQAHCQKQQLHVRIVVIGATGLIGAAATARLFAEGHELVAIGRRAATARRRLSWVTADLRALQRTDDWLANLAGADAVVNCAGVLQDNANDSTTAVHCSSATALFAARARAAIKRVVHISAIGVDREAPTAFSRSKAQGDAALMASGLDWVILRPSVVVGRAAYGGSALFRGLAALPLVPRIAEAGRLQVVQLDDVAAAIAYFVRPDVPGRVQLELAGPDRLTLEEVITLYRDWLGLPPARQIAVPRWLLAAACWLGDFAAWLGWRPPLRSTVRREIVRDAIGDPGPWRAATGIVPQSLVQALAAEPAAVQERWFSRLYLLKPLVFVILSLFWVVTAVISLGPGWNFCRAFVRQTGTGDVPALLLILGGAVADFLVGVGIAIRGTARSALNAALALSVLYLAVATILVPTLWVDPLGPLLKIFPVLALNLAAQAILEDR